MTKRLQDMTLEEILEFKKIRRYSKARVGEYTEYMIDGSLDLSGLSLKRLPLLTHLVMGGSFNCANNGLLSFRNCPQAVGGDFICDQNLHVPNLHGLPTQIGGQIVSDFGTFKSLTDLKEKRPELLQSDYRKPESKHGITDTLLKMLGIDRTKPVGR